MELLKNVGLFTQVAPLSTGNSDSTSSVAVDTANYGGVMFLGIIGKSTAGSTGGDYAIKVLHSDSTASTSYTTLSTGAGLTTVTTGYLGKIVAVDVVKPLKRYIKAGLNRGAASVANGGVIAIGYNPRKAPIDQSTTYVPADLTLTSPST